MNLHEEYWPVKKYGDGGGGEWLVRMGNWQACYNTHAAMLSLRGVIKVRIVCTQDFTGIFTGICVISSLSVVRMDVIKNLKLFYSCKNFTIIDSVASLVYFYFTSFYFISTLFA